MEVNICSDLHADYNGINPLELHQGNKESILVIAGDIRGKGNCLKEVQKFSHKWKEVIIVLGNHDWWGLALHERHKFKSIDNIHFLLEDFIVIDNIAFYGTTLWHDLSDYDIRNAWYYDLNDRKKIRARNYKKLSHEDIHNEYIKGKQFIEKHYSDEYDHKIIITHHPMSRSSSDKNYCHDINISKLYTNDLSHLLYGYDYHIHGHVHARFDYIENDCHVICEPKGYDGENPDFILRNIII